MATMNQLHRVFRLGATDLPDPDPQMTPAEVMAHYANQYPTLRYGKVDDGTVDTASNAMIYVLTPNEYKANG